MTFSSNVNLKGNLYKCVLEIRWEEDIIFNILPPGILGDKEISLLCQYNSSMDFSDAHKIKIYILKNYLLLSLLPKYLSTLKVHGIK